jgi:SanA protein
LFKRLRKIRWKAAWLGLLIALVPVAINVWIVRSGAARTFTDLASVPANDVGLVLGASPRAGEYVNPHFQARIEAAARLYHAGKVKHLLLSGDNHIEGYDEPSSMKEMLVKLGVPEAAMTLDYAGFRTLDSVARAKAVFGQTRLTIITDDFHVARALFLCRAQGIEAVAFCSDTIPLKYSGMTRVRELLARVKAWLDVYVLRTGPKFYGPKVEIKIAEK